MSDSWSVVTNLRVAEDHTYFVGCDEWGFSVWAHNVYDDPKLVRRFTRVLQDAGLAPHEVSGIVQHAADARIAKGQARMWADEWMAAAKGDPAALRSRVDGFMQTGAGRLYDAPTALVPRELPPMASDALFQQLNLRTNAKLGHGSEEAIMGNYVDRRLSLQDVATRGEGHYLYAVDAQGRMALGPQSGANHVQNHSSLIPPREQVRVAGELKVGPDGVVTANTQSGHFMLKDQIRTAQELAHYQAAMRAAITESGMAPGRIINGPHW